MKLKNKYIILRHGQTTYQIKKKKLAYPWPEKSPIILTDKGIKQVELSAKKLKKEKIDLVYSSDVYRTKYTAGIIMENLKVKGRVIFDKRLRDVNLGVFRGKPREQFFDIFPKFSEKWFYEKPKGGESWTDCQERVVSFLKEIDKKRKNKIILIVSHGDPLWLLEGAVKGLSNKDLVARKKKSFLKTGSFKKLNY